MMPEADALSKAFYHSYTYPCEPHWAGLRPPRPPASDALSFPLAQLDAFVWQ
jgi:hypothetical protein